MYKDFFDEITDKKLVSNWYNIRWKHKQNFLTKIQQEIYLSSLRGETSRMIQFQKIILGSLNSKCFATKIITDSREYNNLSNATKIKIALSLRIHIPQTLYLYWKGLKINLPYSEFSQIYNQGLQLLILLALEPQWEAYHEPGVLSFRSQFSARDAVLGLCQEIRKNTFSYAILGNIHSDINLEHRKILFRKIFTCKLIFQVINSLTTNSSLKHSHRIHSRLSNLIFTILIYGLQYNFLDANLPFKDFSSIYYINYQKSFGILCKTKDMTQCSKEIFIRFFQVIKLPINQREYTLSKNCFELIFLGFIMKKSSRKLDLIPDQNSKKDLIYNIRKILYKNDFLGRKRALTYLSLEKAIQKINPLLINWENYFQICTKNYDFILMDKIIDNTIYRWQIKKYKKNRVNSWKQHCTKYIEAKKRIAEGNSILKLLHDQYISRISYIPLIYARSCYDQDIEYWFLRKKF